MTLMTGHCWHEEIMPRIKRGTDPLGTAPAYRQPSGTERHSSSAVTQNRPMKVT
jgi:hypothetical protein